MGNLDPNCPGMGVVGYILGTPGLFSLIWLSQMGNPLLHYEWKQFSLTQLSNSELG